jgi:phosphomannomutase
MSLFGTAGIRGKTADRITPTLALRVGKAIGNQAASDGTAVAVGRDGRITGPALLQAVAAGVVSAGAVVEQLDMVPTPTLAFASRGQYGVMVTASHNPPQDNGLKLFHDGMELSAQQEAEIEELVTTSPDPASWENWTCPSQRDVTDTYIDTVISAAARFGASPDGMHVAIDCANGVAARATPSVLRQLGATVHAVNSHIDGHFPGRGSKPTPESLESFRQFVANQAIEFGIAHDGDGDRIVIINSDGDIIHEDTILAILAGEYVNMSSADSPVVLTTPNTSARVDSIVEENGGHTRRVSLGALHEGLLSLRDAGESVAFAAEPWKHIHPYIGDWIDAIASAAILTRLISVTPLSERRQSVPERPYRKESIACPDEKKKTAMTAVSSAVSESFDEAMIETTHGIRATFPDESWFLVRPSGTESYLRIYIESPSVESLTEEVSTLVRRAVARVNK